MDILQIEHLTKTYGSGDTAVRALDDVSFTVAAGEFVAIIGSSGSGKSTLLHMIGGVDRPTSGTVRLNGEDVFQRSTSSSRSSAAARSGWCISSTTSSRCSTW